MPHPASLRPHPALVAALTLGLLASCAAPIISDAVSGAPSALTADNHDAPNGAPNGAPRRTGGGDGGD